MIRVRYIVLLLLSLCCLSSWGQEDFNPSDPPDPGSPPMKLEVVVSPADAGSVSGAGLYAAGVAVKLSAYVNTGFRFVSWTDNQGNVLSTSTSFTYTKGEGHEQLKANYEFSPDAPADPANPQTILYYQLTLKATEGGTVSGGGRYLAGKQVKLTANPESQFYFDGWYDSAGEKLSSKSTFQYTTTDKHLTLEGRFIFNPDSPSEPEDLGLYHTVTASATEGGTVNFSSKRVKEGASISLSATKNTGYIFNGWYLNGELYSNKASVSYTVTAESQQDFEARFEFSPDSPSDPSASNKNAYSIFLLNQVAKPGDMVEFPVCVSNVSPLTDISFQLTFDPELKPDLSSVELAQHATGYNVSCTAMDNNTYAFAFTGGQLPEGNAPFFTLQIPIPDDMATATGYPVKISQVSITKDDGTTQTASTRNGRVSVYKLGDSNGDDEIDVADLAGVACFMLDKPEDHLIFYASDMDGNQCVEERDYDILVDSILNMNYIEQQNHARVKSAIPKATVIETSKIELPNVAKYDSSKKLIRIPIHFTNGNGIVGFQFDLYMSEDVDIPTDENGDFVIELAPGTKENHVLSMRSKESGMVRIICSSKTNALFADGEDVIYVTLKVKGNVDIDHLDIDLENIIMTDSHAVRYTLENKTGDILIKEEDDNNMKGDANDDQAVNAADIVTVVNYIMGKQFAGFNKDGADANEDGTINAADIVTIVNMIMGK